MAEIPGEWVQAAKGAIGDEIARQSLPLDNERIARAALAAVLPMVAEKVEAGAEALRADGRFDEDDIYDRAMARGLDRAAGIIRGEN